VRWRWTHIGDGPELRRVSGAVRDAPANLEVRLSGRQTNDVVRRHYRETPVDAFVLASTHEGLPVSIQEALAAGVPVVATSVGGVPEAVGDDNGVLLPAAATVEEIVRALERVLLAPDAEDAARRRASRARWVRDFDAERNHAAFATALDARARAL
jgi:glycosyltransferase involved in cell wall biosynthesis